MPFPADLEALQAAEYAFLRSEPCPDCREIVEVFSTPGKREITMNPMCLLTTPAVRHVLTCGQASSITMQTVNDKNMTHCGWRDGTLEIWFRHGKYQYANVPEDVFVKLSNHRQPYPNNIFTKLVKNHPELYPYTKLS